MKHGSRSIAIAGGGLGGLTLARLLQRAEWDVAVYERDASPSVRTQGGLLDMHEESGQRALREAGLEAAFRAMVLPGGQDTRVVDETGRVHFSEAGPEGESGRPEVKRSELRAALLASLEPGTVRWGQDVRGVTPDEGSACLTLGSGEAVRASVVVGADGASSRVRPYLSSVVPTYGGISFVEVGIPNVDASTRDLDEVVGHGTLFALGGGKALLVHGGERICVYIAFRCDADWLAASAIPFDRPREARVALASHFADWSPSLLQLMERCDDTLVPRLIYALPVGHRWSPKPGVTLLGDAAHLMSPFAGEGANLAMLDAVELAHALDRHDDVNGALHEFEEAMFTRAATAAAESAKNQAVCFGPDAAKTLAGLMMGHGRVP